MKNLWIINETVTSSGTTTTENSAICTTERLEEAFKKTIEKNQFLYGELELLFEQKNFCWKTIHYIDKKHNIIIIQAERMLEDSVYL